MRKFLLIAAAVIVIAVAAFLVVVALQPAEFRIARSATIAAPANEVFAQVNSFHKWDDWSPWAKLDPNAKNSFDGPDEGEGAVFSWSGNEEVGEGSMTIVESRPHELIRIKLEFVKPFEDTSDVEFDFQPQGEQTAVTWTMHGKNNFVSKAMCLFMDMDEMIGGKFDEGLANLKNVVETETPPSDETPSDETPEDS